MRRPSRLASRSPNFLQQLVVDQVDEVGRFAGIDAGRGKMQRLGLGALGLVLGDVTGFDHGVENQVAAFDGALRMAERAREVVGTLESCPASRALSARSSCLTSLPK